MAKDISWQSEGDLIPPGIAKEILYRNGNISSFLDILNKHFIVAGKGLGKTVLLKTKRFLLESKKTSGTDSPIAFVPSDTPYLDKPSKFESLDSTRIGFLCQHEKAIKVWEFSIQLSAITVFVSRTKFETQDDIISLLPPFMADYINKYIELTPCDVLGLLLLESVSNINRIIDDYLTTVRIAYSKVHTPIYIFIDQIDQAFLSTMEGMWYTMQTGLMEAAWSCMRTNHHIKIYASLRVEAYKNHESSNIQALAASVTSLSYSKTELVNILDSLSNYYEGKKFLDFVGFSSFNNSMTNTQEEVFDYIYRHTTGSPRNLVCIVLKLNEAKIDAGLFDAESLQKQVDLASYDSISKASIVENEIFMKALETVPEWNRLFSLIHRNVLYPDELKSICRMFNGMKKPIEDADDSFFEADLDDSAEHCINCCDCKKLHPFCELHNIGLLGTVQEIRTGKLQTFKQPHELRGNLRSSLNRNSEVYLLHPSLNGHIKENRDLQGRPFSMTSSVTVGNTCPWTEIDASILTIQKKIEVSKITDKTRKILYDILDNIYKADVSVQINNLTDELTVLIERLRNKAVHANNRENNSLLEQGKQQEKQIKDVTKLLSKLNKKLHKTTKN